MGLIVGRPRIIGIGVREITEIKELFDTRRKITAETEDRETIGTDSRHIPTGSECLNQETAQYQD